MRNDVFVTENPVRRKTLLNSIALFIYSIIHRQGQSLRFIKHSRLSFALSATLLPFLPLLPLRPPRPSITASPCRAREVVSTCSQPECAFETCNIFGTHKLTLSLVPPDSQVVDRHEESPQSRSDRPLSPETQIRSIDAAVSRYSQKDCRRADIFLVGIFGY